MGRQVHNEVFQFGPICSDVNQFSSHKILDKSVKSKASLTFNLQNEREINPIPAGVPGSHRCLGEAGGREISPPCYFGN